MNHLNEILQTKDRTKPNNQSTSGAMVGNKLTSVNRQNYLIEDKVIENKAGINFVEIAKQRFGNSTQVAIGNQAYMVDGELTLPEAILSLVDNPMYLPRYKKLAKVHGVDYLLKLAELARLKNHYLPSRWFAKCCGVQEWQDKTLKMLSNLFKKIQSVKERTLGLGVNPNYTYYYLKAWSKLSESQVNKLLETAKARWVHKPPRMLAIATKQALTG